MDFLYHLDISPEAQLKCVELLRQFILHHVEKELRNNPQFNGIFVLSDVNENDGSKVSNVR